MWRVYVNGEWFSSFDDMDDAQQCAWRLRDDESYGSCPDVQIIADEDC